MHQAGNARDGTRPVSRPVLSHSNSGSLTNFCGSSRTSHDYWTTLVPFLPQFASPVQASLRSASFRPYLRALVGTDLFGRGKAAWLDSIKHLISSSHRYLVEVFLVLVNQLDASAVVFPSSRGKCTKPPHAYTWRSHLSSSRTRRTLCPAHESPPSYSQLLACSNSCTDMEITATGSVHIDLQTRNFTYPQVQQLCQTWGG